MVDPLTDGLLLVDPQLSPGVGGDAHRAKAVSCEH